MVAVVTLLRVLARWKQVMDQLSNVRSFSFFDQERVQPPSLKVTVLTFLVKHGKMKLSGSLYFENTRKNLKSISYS